MRILSLGVPLPGASIDNHSFLDAPSFFDYDALIVDVRALSQAIEEVIAGARKHTTRSGERVVNEPGAHGTVALGDLLRDRRDETARLLARGGLVVCFAFPSAVHEGVAGLERWGSYCWLPAPKGLAYGEPFLRRAEGSEIVPAIDDHAFAPYVRRLHGKLAYHALLDESAPAVAGAARVFARSAGGAATGVELALERGHIVFVPPPARPAAGDELYALSETLQEAVRQSLRPSASGPPRWLAEYGAQAGADEAERFLALLWQEGKDGLEGPVRDALRAIGFAVLPDDLDRPAELREPDSREAALLEVDAGVEAAGMAGHHRLRARIEESIERGAPKRALLVINGYRRRPPAERPPQYSDALRIASERMRYCVATTEQLFHAVRAALAGDEDTVRSFRERLLQTEGILQTD